MFKVNLESKLLVAWSEKIDSTATTEALRYIVGYAGCSPNWSCHPQWKGYLPDFRFHGVHTGKQFVSFVPAKNWILLYFRKPAVTSGDLTWDRVVAAFPEAEEKSGEWRVRIHDLKEAKLVTTLIEVIAQNA